MFLFQRCCCLSWQIGGRPPHRSTNSVSVFFRKCRNHKLAKNTICLRRGICEKGNDNFCSILGLFVVWVIYDVNLGPRRSGFYPPEKSWPVSTHRLHKKYHNCQNVSLNIIPRYKTRSLKQPRICKITISYSSSLPPLPLKPTKFVCQS